MDQQRYTAINTLAAMQLDEMTRQTPRALLLIRLGHRGGLKLHAKTADGSKGTSQSNWPRLSVRAIGASQWKRIDE